MVGKKGQYKGNKLAPSLSKHLCKACKKPFRSDHLQNHYRTLISFGDMEKYKLEKMESGPVNSTSSNSSNLALPVGPKYQVVTSMKC